MTTGNPARYLRIDNPGKSSCTIRIDANRFNAWEQKILVPHVGETRMRSPSSELIAVSADVPADAAQAAIDLVSAKTKSIVPKTALRVMPLTGLVGSCPLVNNEVLNRSIQRKTT